ncbi:793_t:CDS:2 [Paraglomus brasilianum]|uniref:793_t:CDS:1 n=1 Tax=Paraglomus brasilianum TaxID=144538 RepID=A0A9N9DH78_9GLOM|nr:793_t:CDS:2 [Paraglomus brasilianum]
MLLDELFEAGVTEEHQTDDIEIESIEDESEGKPTNTTNGSDDMMQLEDDRDAHAESIINFSDSEDDIEEIFDGPKNEFRYKWNEFQQILLNIFGERTELLDVPRKYIADALVKVRVFKTESDSPPESIQIWKNRLQSWRDKMLEMRTLCKLRKVLKANVSHPKPRLPDGLKSQCKFIVPWNRLRVMWIMYFGLQEEFPDGVSVK